MSHSEEVDEAHYTSNIIGDVIGLVMRIGEFFVSLIITFAIHKVLGLSMGWYSFFILTAVAITMLFLVGGKLDDYIELSFPPVLKESNLGRLKNSAYEWIAKLIVFGIYGTIAWLVYLDFRGN